MITIFTKKSNLTRPLVDSLRNESDSKRRMSCNDNFGIIFNNKLIL